MLRQHLQKVTDLRLCCFKSDWDEVWQECSWSKCTSSDRVGFWYDVIL